MTSTDAALKMFQECKVMQLKDLVEILKCSIPTVRRRLQVWKTYTSFNHNGRYYTLPIVPQFNEFGIWKYKNILFSKHGNLKKTLVNCIEQSISGLSVNEISEVLSMPAFNFLGHFQYDPNIQRHKYKGVYIYFSKKAKIFKKQKNERDKILHSSFKMYLPSDAEAVNILVEFIKHFGETTEQLAHRLRRKGHKIPITVIRNLLTYHGLEKKTLGLDQSNR